MSDGTPGVPIDGRVRTNHVIAARDAVRAGLGIGRLPHWIIQDELRRGSLVRVLETVRMPRIDIVGVYHRASAGSASLRVVLDALRTELPRRTAMHSVDRPR
jgi:DNA-binding transcriptional LysR family regulator